MADFIVLATADWDHPLWTNKQHTAMSLAALGHRVLYVESLGLRPPRKGAADPPRILKRLRRVARPPRRVQRGIWVWSPLVLPGASHPWAQRLNPMLVRGGLLLMRRWLGLRDPILWTYNPLSLDVLDPSSFSKLVYHCVDRIQAQPEMPGERIQRAEQQLCRAASVVFTTAPELQRSLAPLNRHTHLFGNVADFDHFARAWQGPTACPAALASLPSPRLIFIGAIDAYKLDLTALTQLARRRPDWSLVLVGPIGEADPSTDIGALRLCSNVHWLGPRAYADLPDWLAHADVALLPLQLNSYTRNMFPMKFFEYLAAGLPVVATAIPSLKGHEGAALLVPPGADHLETAIDRALQGQGPERAERLVLAQKHTYSARSQSMLAVLDRLGLLDPSGVGGRRRSWRLALALHRDDVAGAASQIRRLWEKHQSLVDLHQLLFRRRARPASTALQVRLFESLRAVESLPFAERTYCSVVLTYRGLKDRRPDLLHSCRSDLEGAIQTLERDPGTGVCQRANRRNRAKLLVSCAMALSLVHASARDVTALLALGRRLAVWFDQLDLESINADAAFRMTRNLCRCLLLEAVSSSSELSRRRLARLVAFTESDRYRDHPAQEDHRRIAHDALTDLEQGTTASRMRLCVLIADEKRDLGVTGADLFTLLEDDGLPV